MLHQLPPTMVLLLLLLLPLTLLQVSHSFVIPLPGGKRIRFEEGGIIRIQYDEKFSDIPPMPPRGTKVPSRVLESTEVRDTGTVKGFGVYCTKPLDPYMFLGFYEGRVILSREELDQLTTPNEYVMSIDGGATFLDGYERAQNRTIMSPVHLNHEDKDKDGCNCLRILENGNIAFFTSRRIEVGEELCFNYGLNYWKDRENQKI
mmetsp:Transcript_24476/g.44275  ORF Transcript_24476/g.44275 Transcript_24476/m.44275 type:complete len:204 (-) Transcript_24476:369-980(-)